VRAGWGLSRGAMVWLQEIGYGLMALYFFLLAMYRRYDDGLLMNEN